VSRAAAGLPLRGLDQSPLYPRPFYGAGTRNVGRVVRDPHRQCVGKRPLDNRGIQLFHSPGLLRKDRQPIVEHLRESAVDKEYMRCVARLYAKHTDPQLTDEWRSIRQNAYLSVVCGKCNEQGLALKDRPFGGDDAAMERVGLNHVSWVQNVK